MAELFVKQAEEYVAGRPGYPPELFRFIASKIPSHDLAWDVGTGSGQAARSLATIFKNVVATDTSPKQLELAPKLPNVRYHLTPPIISLTDLTRHVAPESTVDLVTVAQAIHWFDLPSFYSHVRHVLKKPDGVIAVWCYTNPEVSPAVDGVFRRFYTELGPYWDPARRMVEDGYVGVDFPFQAVDGEGEGETGPFRFEAEKDMKLGDYLTYLRSSSAYQTAKEKGIELLTAAVMEDFAVAWREGKETKTVRFPVYLRIGKVGLTAHLGP